MLHFPKAIRLQLLIPLLLFTLSSAFALSPAETISNAVILEDKSEEQINLINSLEPSAEVSSLLTLWKEGGIFLWEKPDHSKVAITLSEPKDAADKQAASYLGDGKPLLGPDGQHLRLVASDLTAAETDSSVRAAMKAILDLGGLVSPDTKVRLQAVETLGMEQDSARLPLLTKLAQKETDPQIQRGLKEAIALTELKDTSADVRVLACRKLGELGSIRAQDALKALAKESGDTVQKAALEAIHKIELHLQVANTFGTLFRGLSLGSVLLVAALGLAVTFGLMGIINMAHGEMIAVGAYTTYVVQCVFGPGLQVSPFGLAMSLPGMRATGWLYDLYFVLAIPLSFITAAIAGIILERTVIRFLYRRPLESLLATWGVSLVVQQLFRLTFGANNVQVASPSWLSGNWTISDVSFGWNRLFVITFAIAIVFGVFTLLSRTPLGLLIRAVMQNRAMAACMGVRTQRVNMLTFGLGSGLAGLAGAFLSQISNVGPSLGQSYIVDAFMTVVVGGVGSLFGTIFSALGIGMVDQILQQVLGNPVLGKILVLAAIILFLQWRPAGLFVTRSRSLEN
ncbi:MAG: urea ABC transporter permease subunit UrtB [Verrucomicrobiota bacterium]